MKGVACQKPLQSSAIWPVGTYSLPCNISYLPSGRHGIGPAATNLYPGDTKLMQAWINKNLDMQIDRSKECEIKNLPSA
ncbi:MAG: hypothetical protein IAE87_18815 [Rhodobacteraceae bacterium]|nr:hypothetical protein [Paracoccaceae bacterium]